MLQVDNKLVTLNHDIPAIRTYYNVDGKWKQLDKFKYVTICNSVRYFFIEF